MDHPLPAVRYCAAPMTGEHTVYVGRKEMLPALVGATNPCWWCNGRESAVGEAHDAQHERSLRERLQLAIRLQRYTEAIELRACTADVLAYLARRKGLEADCTTQRQPDRQG